MTPRMGLAGPLNYSCKQHWWGKQRQHAMMPKQISSLLFGICLVAATSPYVCFADDSFQIAQQEYARQNWAAALEQFERVTQQAKDDATRVPALFYSAECALQLKDYGQAQTLYRRIIDSAAASEFHQRASFRLAESRQLSGDLQGALAEFRRFVETYPRDELTSDARNRIGEILLQTRCHDSALTEFAYVVEHCPREQSERARLGMARSLLALKRCDEVPVALGRLCQSKDQLLAAEALLLLGRARYEAGQHDQSLTTFRRVYSLNGARELTCRARLAAGWALWKQLRLEEVAAEVESLEEYPEFEGDYHYLLGMTAYAAKDWGAAKKQLGLAAQAKGENQVVALFYAGESALFMGNPKSAKASYLRLLEIDSASEWADDALWGLVKVARLEKSEAEFAQACEQLRSKFPRSDYVNQIALLATKSGNQLREPDPSAALFEEALDLERDGRFGGAIAAYNEFLSQTKDEEFRAEALWRAARLHGRLKQYAESRELYTRLLADFPEFDRAPDALAHLAQLEAACGNATTAAKSYRELLEKFPQSSQAIRRSGRWIGC